MPISLHSHSGQYCKHAKGTLREVVLAAISAGFTAYGLSEHMPRTRTQDLYPEELELSMTPQDTNTQFQDFLKEARLLQLEFKDRIHLIVGMETELIHAETLAEATQLVQQHNLDYLVGSVHHVNQVPIDFDLEMYNRAESAALEKKRAMESENGKESSLLVNDATECLFQDYFDAQYELLRNLKPQVVGHFDLIGMFRPDHELSQVCWEKIRRNVAVIVEYDGIVEVNSRAWKKGLAFAYPRKSIMEYMISQGVKFCLSDDSHGPNDVGMHYSRLLEYIKEVGVNTIYYPAPPSLKTETSEILRIDNVSGLPFWHQFSAKT
ncbi:Polymerase/histidinol phosphatase-like protein [Obelidium mucronatum]|nr:Polymerase/histidinol phosphatase-like protein [Obelidium mucronatum]